MPALPITVGIQLCLNQLKNVRLFTLVLKRHPEFENNSLAKGQLASVREAISYSESLLKQLSQKAAAYALKEDRILPEKER